jgi:murein DD-endopeptidase MepM/ murein hydrolase activator NlpD
LLKPCDSVSIATVRKGNLMKFFQLGIVFLVSAFRLSAQPGSLGAWTATQPFPYPISCKPAAVAFQGRIYVLGGYAAPSGPDYLDNSVHTAVINSDGSLQPWQTTTPFAHGRQWHAAALNSGTRTIYIIGGATNTCCFDAPPEVQYATILPGGGVGPWTSTTPLPTGISGLSAFCYDNYLYVFRANDQTAGTGMRQGYYYAPIKPDGSVGSWTLGKLSFSVRRYLGAFAYNDHFYAVGGDNGSGRVDAAFNEVRVARVPQRSSLSYLQMNETEVWNTTTPFQVARTCHGAVCENGYVYITGGINETTGTLGFLSDVQYARILSDGSLDSWRTTTALPSAVTEHACVIYAGHIYVIGGYVPTGAYSYRETASVYYTSIQSSSDTTPPKTQVLPSPGQPSYSPLNVTLTATDIGGSGVVSIRRTTDGSDPNTSGSAIIVNSSSVNFWLPIPATLKFSARDAAGNIEQVQTAIYSAGSTPIGIPLLWPMSGSITEATVDRGGKANHNGTDISSGGHAPVFAAAIGKVSYIGLNSPSAGNYVVIDHGDDYTTRYLHLQNNSIPLQLLGKQVDTTTQIGIEGDTGNVTGTHLHFEFFRDVNGNNIPERDTEWIAPTPYWEIPHWPLASPPAPKPYPYSATKGEIISGWPTIGYVPLQRLTSSGVSGLESAPAISADGVWIGFRNSPTYHLYSLSDSSMLGENFDGDATSGNGSLFTTVFSTDGRFKAFSSDDSNLVQGDTNGLPDVFVQTITNGSIERLSISTTGEQANGASYDVGISGDGRYVAFTSVATNLVTNDTNRVTDIFVRDRETNQTFLASVNSDGAPGNGPSYSPSISADGRFVAFISEATNMVASDTNGVDDVFVRDIRANTTEIVSRTWNGALANGACRQPSISGDGRYIAYESDASNLVLNDTNGFADVFVYDRTTGLLQKISTGSNGEQANGSSHEPRISSYGLRIAFVSEASNLSANDTNGLPDIFVFSLAAPPVLGVSIAGNSVVLSWPTNSTIFNLESTTNLNSSAWLPVMPTPFTIGEYNFVTNPIVGNERFFRLKK